MVRLSLRWLLLVAMLSDLLATAAATDTMTPGDTVSDGESLISTGGGFRLGFFSPGRSRFRYLGIRYDTISKPAVIWVANRDRGIDDNTGVLSFHGNGSLVLSDAKGEVYWSTRAAAAGVATASPVARLLDNANFVVITDSGGGTPAWQSFDFPTDSQLPGMKLGWDLRSGRNRNLTPWRSADDPAPGRFAVGMDVPDDPQITVVRRSGGGARLWRSGPWIGQGFSRIPEMSDDDMFTFSFHNDGADEVYYRFDARKNNTVPAKLTAQTSGVVQLLVWVEGAKSWSQVWFAPKDQCDIVSPCGPFGVCDTNRSPLCSCVKGFEPRSPPDWYLRDWSGGCARTGALDCRNGRDGFAQVAVASLPDTAAAVVNYAMGPDECRAACLRNCSCTAYATVEVAGARGGRGCALWGGNLTDVRGNAIGDAYLYVRVVAASAVQSASSSKWVVAVLAVGVVVGTTVLGWICWFLWRQQLRRRKTTVVRGLRKNNGMCVVGSGAKTKKKTTVACQIDRTSCGSGEDLNLPLLDFRRIAVATDGFSAENKLGEGGFGPVYVGRLSDGQEVAVKRLARNSAQGVEEFKNEVMLIAKLQHRNLVRLLGCCVDGEERMLVYEYMPNGSLDTFLFDRTKGSLLDWNTRYKIIKGIAQGLLYLHQDSRLRIIHRDLKASNVLLDKEMNPKISDFGMARKFSEDQTEANTKRVAGTYGYMSPEYIMRGLFSVKSDVFSFGVVILEIVSGRRNRAIYLSDPNLNLLGYAWSLWMAGKWMEMVDPSMTESILTAASEVLKCFKVGLLCVQEHPEDRPTMASVVKMWEDSVESLPQPKQPAFMVTRGPLERLYSTINEVTVTDVHQGR